jgi:beta-lactamase regulating signal transducer with metallopeptidase domain
MTHVNFAMTTLLNGIWQGALLAGAMWMLLKLIPRVNAATRFMILWLTLAAVAILPFLPMMLTGDSASLRRAAAPVAFAPITLAPTVAGDSGATSAFAPVEVRQRGLTPGIKSESNSVVNSEANFELESEAGVARGSVAQISPAEIGAASHSPLQIRSGRVIAGFVILWGAVTLLLGARLGASYRMLRRLKSEAAPGPDHWRSRLSELCAANGVRRQARLLISDEIAAPMSLGFFDPAILIPRTLLDGLSEAELDHIVLHELAHLLRYDDWMNLTQKLIEVLLPIQPAVFWLGRGMSLEREMACDDWVIAATGTARPYAVSLTKVAELSRWEHAGILAAGAAGNRSQLFRRVHHMLDRTRNAAPRLSYGPVAVALVAVAALIYEGGRAPQMIAFAQNTGEESGQTALRSLPVVQAPQTPQSVQSAQGSNAAVRALATLTAIEPRAPMARLDASSALLLTAPIVSTASLALTAPLAPGEAVASQQNAETHMHMRNQNGTETVDLKIDGTIEFTDDDRDVKSLSPNGYFRLEEGGWFSGHEYEVKADGAGKLTKSYSVGMHEKPMDDEGRAWLGRALPQIIRDSGIAAGPRVARILRQGGPQAVLTEIGLIHSDGSRRIYLEQLFSQAALNTAQLEDAAKLMQEISSDGDKAQVIMAEDAKYFTAELRPRLFQATESISSDGDKRRVLSDISQKDGGNAATMVGVERIARHISSDGDKAEVLIEIANRYGASDEVRVAFFEAVDSISSDGDHARVLSKLLAGHGSDRDTMVRALRSAGHISSDGDKARVLTEAVASYTEDDSERRAFVEAANSISSDGDHQRVLVALIHRQGIGAGTLGGIANSAQRISSDGDKAHVLVELASANVEQVRDAFFAATDSINSDGDRSRVILALLDKAGTSTGMVIGAIHSATGISSDGDKGRVLLDAANRYGKDPGVSAALREAVEGLHSDGEYRAVMSELARQGGKS